MSAYLHLVPGLVKVRVSRNGTRWYLGLRFARVQVGEGGPGVSTGAGPFTWYKPTPASGLAGGSR